MLNQIFGPVLERLPENNRLELIWKLAQIDFKKRYYDNLLGLFWALLNPLFRVAIYFVVFTYILERGNRENFALFLFCGLLFWLFFAEGTKKGIKTMKSKRYLIENIQFNKVDLFVSNTFSVFLGFLFNITAYLVISNIAGLTYSLNILYFPILVLNVFIIILGVSLILATIHIYIKDIMHMWDIVILLGFWMTPIFYSGDDLRARLPFIMYANPMAGVLENGRCALFFDKPPNFSMMLYDIGYGLVLLAIGLYIFNAYSHKAAEKM